MVNDADAAGIAESRYGVARGREGLVIVTTLGTGIGSALLYDGVLVPNSELGHLEIDGHDAETKAANSARKDEDLSWEEWAKRLTKYYRTVERLLAPTLFVVGGGVSKHAAEFVPLIDIDTEIVSATLRNTAGIVGAAALAADGVGLSAALSPRCLDFAAVNDYTPADDRYDTMEYRFCGRSGLKLPARLARALAELRHRPARGDPAGDPAAGLRPRDHALRPRQQLRAAVRPRGGELRSLPARRLRRAARRAADLHQGRLRHVARSLRPGRRLAQVRAVLARPVADPDGPGLRRHLLQPPLRRRDARRGDDDGARPGGALRQGALRRHLLLLGDQDPRGRDHRARAGHPAADPPAVVLPAQPVDRGGPPRRAGVPGHGLHRVHAAGAGAAHRPLPRRGAAGLAGRARRAAAPSRRTTSRSRRSSTYAGSTRSRSAAARSSRSWRCSGCCATSGSPPR